MRQRMNIIEEFLNYLQFELNRSPKTVQSYSEDLKLFEEYFKNLDTHLSWESVDSDIIRDWMESMMDKGNSARSVCRRLAALHSLYRFALSRSLVDKDPSRGIVAPKGSKPLPQFLKEKEMNQLLDHLEWGTEFKDVRTRTIIMVFYETGIRLSELVGLDDADVDLSNGQLKVTGKGNKQRIVPFGKELCKTLAIYRDDRDRLFDRNDTAFFVSDKGTRMLPSTVRRHVEERIAQVSSLKKKSPHVLRHTFATAMLNHGAGIENVKKLLGHASVSTTEIYTHTTFEQLKRVYEKAHPRA
jgi:integrase/recombinase XerC